jgi:hypothetical protein
MIVITLSTLLLLQSKPTFKIRGFDGFVPVLGSKVIAAKRAWQTEAEGGPGIWLYSLNGNSNGRLTKSVDNVIAIDRKKRCIVRSNNIDIISTTNAITSDSVLSAQGSYYCGNTPLVDFRHFALILLKHGAFTIAKSAYNEWFGVDESENTVVSIKQSDNGASIRVFSTNSTVTLKSNFILRQWTPNPDVADVLVYNNRYILAFLIQNLKSRATSTGFKSGQVVFARIDTKTKTTRILLKMSDHYQNEETTPTHGHSVIPTGTHTCFVAIGDNIFSFDLEKLSG